MLAQLCKFLVALWNEEKRGTRFKDVRTTLSRRFNSFHGIRGKLMRNARSLIGLYYIFITTNTTERVVLAVSKPRAA